MPLIIISPDVIFINTTNSVVAAAAVAVCERDRQTGRVSHGAYMYGVQLSGVGLLLLLH